MRQRARAFLLLGALVAAAACGGEARSDARDRTVSGPPTGGGADAATGGAATGGAANGGTASEPVEPCGEEGLACCPDRSGCTSGSGGCLLIGYVRCFDPRLQCCEDVCRLSCDAPEATLDGWSTAPECDLAPYKACAADGDCALVEHRLNCCGSRRLVGVAASEVASVQALIATCAPTDQCNCAALVYTETGVAYDADASLGEPFARCRDGACESTAPPLR